jgi:large subunit ribosomal protein L10
MITRELTEALKGVSSLVVVSSKGVPAKADNEVRRALHAKKIEYMVVKNSLAKRALKTHGVTAADPFLDGPSAIAFTRTGELKEVASELLELTKKIKQLQIKGGVLEGEGLDPKGVETVATGPGKKEYIARVVSLINGPAQRLASLVAAPAGQIAGQVKEIAKKAEGGAAAPAAEAKA